MIDRPAQTNVLYDLERHFGEVTEFLNQPDAGVGVFKWCIETNGVQVTDSYLEMTGAKENEVEHGLLSLIHPSHRKRAARELRRAILGNSERFESLYRMHNNNRVLQMFLFKGIILRRESVPVGIFGMAIDVTNILKLIMQIGSH
jgi:PAS domain-containing protein